MSCRRLFPLAAAIVGIWVSSVSAQTITEFPLPTAGTSPNWITAGPDGNLWFTEFGGPGPHSTIGRITPLGVVTEFPIVLPPAGQGVPAVSIATGSDGNLWFTISAPFSDRDFAAIGRSTPSGVITIFETLPGSEPFGIAAGPDGALWFTERNAIARITTTGVVTRFAVATPPGDIVAGPDGNLWFYEGVANKIGRITTAGVVTEFPIPTLQTGGGSIAVGSDGNLWFTEIGANKIGRITPAGVITEFPVTTVGSAPLGITGGPDGNLWFTELEGNKVGRITPSGVITEFDVPTPGSGPAGITAGPGGTLWFTEFRVNKIGRITLGATPSIDLRILPVVGSTPGAGGTFFRTSVQLHNGGTTLASGRIVFHSSGSSGSDSDVALSYSLGPGSTESIVDLLPAMNRSGLGSADILVASGATPTLTARVFNDAGAAGTTGFTETAMRPEEALRSGQEGVLLVPADLVTYRMNIGVRTLEATLMTLTVRNAAGVIAATVPRFFPAVYHDQQPASTFLSGLPLPPGGSITVSVDAGRAIVYGATVDNRTGDPSLQIARAAP